MKRNCTTVESDILENLATARECWKALQTLHLDEGPIKQVNLIQNALAQRVARDKEQVTKVRQVREDIRRAFRMPGGITEETFVNITCLIVLGAGHDHLRAMIQRDMQAATSTNPFLSEQIISYLEQDLQLLEGDEQRNGTAGQAVALATQGRNGWEVYLRVDGGEAKGARCSKELIFQRRSETEDPGNVQGR
ncbi:hypothetical protein BDZ97DRAFT_1762165 [Flammula alnicola]|nr:hypothetical protein BDZ97DRAFT_1762165 [Flammula alnicola]